MPLAADAQREIESFKVHCIGVKERKVDVVGHKILPVSENGRA